MLLKMNYFSMLKKYWVSLKTQTQQLNLEGVAKIATYFSRCIELYITWKKKLLHCVPCEKGVDNKYS